MINVPYVPPFFLRYIALISMLLCNYHIEAQKDILQIKIPKTTDGIQVNASDIISNIEYVSLETLPECLIGEFYKISISENYILVFSSNEAKCFLFSRNGKFIRSIGQIGNGPGDYRKDSYSIKIDEKSNIVYLMSAFEIYSYRITGEFVKKFDFVAFKNSLGIKGFFFIRIMHWKDDLFCTNVDLNSGDEQYRFIIFSLDGKIIKHYPNYVHFNKEKGKNENNFSASSIYFDCNIFCYDDQIYFKEILCDTLFMINEQLDLVPNIIFDLPEKSPDVFVQNVYKCENYLFLTGRSYYLYDKKKNKLTVIKHDPSVIREMEFKNLFITPKKAPFHGFTNDIDGGFGFYPTLLHNIQNDKQFVCVYQPYELKKFLTDEYLATRKIKDKEAHKRLKKLLTELDEDDNPVIMIATVR